MESLGGARIVGRVAFGLDVDRLHFFWGHECEPTRAIFAGKTDLETIEYFARGDLHPHLFPRDKWKILENEPLTVEPSISCERCGLSGLIRNGEWIELSPRCG